MASVLHRMHHSAQAKPQQTQSPGNFQCLLAPHAWDVCLGILCGYQLLQGRQYFDDQSCWLWRLLGCGDPTSPQSLVMTAHSLLSQLSDGWERRTIRGSILFGDLWNTSNCSKNHSITWKCSNCLGTFSFAETNKLTEG